MDFISLSNVLPDIEKGTILSSMRYDVVVIGVGTMGSATCYQLAKRGISVLGLEQFDISHDQGSHAGQSRLIRKAYFEHPDYVPLLERAFHLWSEVEKEAGTQLYYPTGILYAGPEHGEVIRGLTQSSKLHNVRINDISQKYTDQWPQFSFPEDLKVYFEPDAGFLLPEKSIRTLVELARRFGATIRTQEKVMEWRSGEDGIEIRTDAGVYHSQKLVITAGAYVKPLLPEMLASRFRITQQILAWYEITNSPDYVMENFPCWGIEVEDGLLYGFPYDDGYAADGPKGLKVAYHRPGEEIVPEKILDYHPENEDRLLRSLLARYLRDKPGKSIDYKSCLYTYSEDDHFVLDFLPGHSDHVVIGTGFSGHGFKFAPVAGEILADLAVFGKTDQPIDFLRLDRFM